MDWFSRKVAYIDAIRYKSAVSMNMARFPAYSI